MDIQIKKWGNSLALRIPQKIAELSNIKENSTIELQVKEGTIILKAKELKLEDLLSQITPENLHKEIDFGLPAGIELQHSRDI